MHRSLIVAAAVAALSLVGAGLAAAQDEVVVTDKDARGWEFTSETNTAGHVQFVLNGVQLKTDDNSGSAAGFKAVSADLKTVAGGQDPSLRYNSQGAGAAAAFQLELNSPTAGWVRLVSGQDGEGMWSATKSCPSCAALLTAKKIQSGTGFEGGYKETLDRWSAAIPDAKVTKIGFKLGTGGPLKGVLSSVKFLGTTYRFGVALAADPPTTPAPPTNTTTPPPPADDLNCDDFPLVDGRTAQQVLDADRDDPNVLDIDRDGIACEVNEQGNGGSNDNGSSSNGGSTSGDTDLNPGPISYSQVESVPQGGVDTGA